MRPGGVMRALLVAVATVPVSLWAGCDTACHRDEVECIVDGNVCEDEFGCAVDFGTLFVGASETRRIVWSANRDCAVDEPSFFDEAGVFFMDDLDREGAAGVALFSARPTAPELQVAAFLVPVESGVTFRLRVQGQGTGG